MSRWDDIRYNHNVGGTEPYDGLRATAPRATDDPVEFERIQSLYSRRDSVGMRVGKLADAEYRAAERYYKSGDMEKGKMRDRDGRALDCTLRALLSLDAATLARVLPPEPKGGDK